MTVKSMPPWAALTPRRIPIRLLVDRHGHHLIPGGAIRAHADGIGGAEHLVGGCPVNLEFRVGIERNIVRPGIDHIHATARIRRRRCRECVGRVRCNGPRRRDLLDCPTGIGGNYPR